MSAQKKKDARPWYRVLERKHYVLLGVVVLLLSSFLYSCARGTEGELANVKPSSEQREEVRVSSSQEGMPSGDISPLTVVNMVVWVSVFVFVIGMSIYVGGTIIGNRRRDL